MIKRIMLLTSPSGVAELQGNRDQAHAGVGRLPGAELRRQRSYVRIVSGAPLRNTLSPPNTADFRRSPIGCVSKLNALDCTP
jgi:hypothetical protein